MTIANALPGLAARPSARTGSAILRQDWKHAPPPGLEARASARTGSTRLRQNWQCDPPPGLEARASARTGSARLRRAEARAWIRTQQREPSFTGDSRPQRGRVGWGRSVYRVVGLRADA